MAPERVRKHCGLVSHQMVELDALRKGSGGCLTQLTP
jgi:hypothetical protein